MVDNIVRNMIRSSWKINLSKLKGVVLQGVINHINLENVEDVSKKNPWVRHMLILTNDTRFLLSQAKKLDMEPIGWGLVGSFGIGLYTGYLCGGSIHLSNCENSSNDQVGFYSVVLYSGANIPLIQQFSNPSKPEDLNFKLVFYMLFVQFRKYKWPLKLTVQMV